MLLRVEKGKKEARRKKTTCECIFCVCLYEDLHKHRKKIVSFASNYKIYFRVNKYLNPTSAQHTIQVHIYINF